MLTIGLAFLAQKGSFIAPGLGSQQQWLLLAPTIVVALIAQHHRRYYSSVTKPVRAVLWGYLAVNVLFGASVAFDVFGGNALDDLASGGMACISLALAGLLIASGDLFERIPGGRYRRSRNGGGATRYLSLVRGYADASVALIACLIVVAIAAMLIGDWGSGRRDQAAKDEAVAAAAGPGSSTKSKGLRPPGRKRSRSGQR